MESSPPLPSSKALAVLCDTVNTQLRTYSTDYAGSAPTPPESVNGILVVTFMYLRLELEPDHVNKIFIPMCVCVWSHKITKN